MNFVFPGIERVFDTEITKVNTLVIENSSFLYKLLSDISAQCNGCDGKAVVSENGKLLPLDKHSELLTDFLNFDINKKSLLTKIVASVEKNAVCSENYLKTTELLSQTEQFINELTFDLPCSVTVPKLTIGSVLKGVGLEITDDYDNVCEKLLDYFALVTEFDRKKLFFLFNLRCYISDENIGLFLDNIISKGYNVLMIESSARALLGNENRLIIDGDLCEIS